MLQLRHLRYFVNIVDAGSFSRAAATIHVAQPALSQQMQELEEHLAVSLLQRHPRGVRPTPAGEVLYREAIAILKRVDELPGIVRSMGGEPEGSVTIGMASTLAATLAGPFVQACRAMLPKVILKLSVAGSETIKAGIEGFGTEVAFVFEDELVARYARRPMFRQRLFYIAKAEANDSTTTIQLSELAMRPMILPGLPNVTRSVFERALAQNGLTARPVAEADQLSSTITAVRQGLGGSLLAMGTYPPDVPPGELCVPKPIEPPIFMTASVLWSNEVPLSKAGEAVRLAMIEFIEQRVGKAPVPGIEPL